MTDPTQLASDTQVSSEDCDDLPPAKCTGAPKRIWLVVGDLDEDCEFDDLDEVSWSSEQIGNQDIEYVRADIARVSMECLVLGCQRSVADGCIQELRAQNAALVEECRHYRTKLRELASDAQLALKVKKS